MSARLAAAAAAAVVFSLAGGASAQTHVGTVRAAGLPWSVAAPGGASWALACRFSPVTMDMSRYDRKHWANGLTRSGQGAMRGRLPVDNGWCILTKTGGSGVVAIAMVKDGEARARATNDPAQPARVGFV
ncbi:hypothetical protein [uncultured Brevundimonas sp.]|uniref:hypothetical protein n=1 Tax=uncultured Brevundimonas sp. TaxID=213418 RepID=UPI0030ECA775|tara:strand:+ start:647 stop:1036 length:390 start_codon:yes stop_codon:yes gene_type:complete